MDIGVLALSRSDWAFAKDFTNVPYNGKHVVYVFFNKGGTCDNGSMSFEILSGWS
jgi:hypothetical protein